MKITIIGLGYVGLPLAVKDEVRAEFDINLIKDVTSVDYDTVIFAVSHDNFLSK